ncbi:MAG: hypothetical protein ABIJ48_02340 [Actinomycetota bacterium]
MDPSDPNYSWLHAAELAACIREASRWDWDADQRRLLAAAVGLSERLYEGAGPDELVSYFEELSEALSLHNGPARWLASLDDSQVGRMMRAAREAFHRLRYHLYEEGPPLAA